MKKQVVIGVLIAIATLLQISLANRIKVWGVAPDLLAIMVIAIGADYGFMQGIGAGFAGGIIVDVLFGYPIGLRMVGYSVLGYLSGTRLFESFRGIFRLAVFTFFILLFRDAASVVLLLIRRATFEGNIFIKMVTASAYSAVLMIPLQFFMSQLSTKKYMRRGSLYT